MRNRKIKFKSLVVSFFLLLTINSISQSGTIDNTFGIRVTPVGISDDAPTSIVIQNDGKIIVGGLVSIGGVDQAALIRYQTNGSIDLTFGTAGKVTSTMGANGGYITSIFIQTDGKIVTGGIAKNGGISEFAIRRFNSNGTIDSSFGTNGITITSIGGYIDVASCGIMLSNGKFILGGSSHNGTNYDFAMIRYNSDGSLDQTFGINGFVTTPIGISHDNVSAIALTPENNLILVGTYKVNIQTNFAMVRYSINGELDSSFGTNGIVTTAIATTYDECFSVAIQTNGKIILAGSTQNGANVDFALARYNVQGTIDNTFGTNGICITPVGVFVDIGKKILIQSDGKILVAGSAMNSNRGYEFALVRYKINGIIDSTFGTNGFVTTAINGYATSGQSAILQNDNKIIVIGSDYNGADQDFAVVRYKNTSSPVTPVASFTTNKLVTFIDSTVQLSDKSINTPNVWKWNITPSTYVFINGSNSNSVDPEIKFRDSGLYTIKLRVSNSAGSDSLTKTNYIKVLGLGIRPVVNFSVDFSSTKIDSIVHLTDLSTNNPTSWVWTISPYKCIFENGTNNRFQNPALRFIDSGCYTVKLRCSNAAGSDSLTKTKFICLGTTNGLTQNQELNSFEIDPNPAIDFIRIKSNGYFQTFNIINMFGQTICTSELIQGETIVDVSMLTPGIYIIKVGGVRCKIIKN